MTKNAVGELKNNALISYNALISDLNYMNGT